MSGEAEAAAVDGVTITDGSGLPGGTVASTPLVACAERAAVEEPLRFDGSTGRGEPGKASELPGAVADRFAGPDEEVEGVAGYAGGADAGDAFAREGVTALAGSKGREAEGSVC